MTRPEVLPDAAAASAMSERIALSVPHLQGHEWAYVKECLDTGWVSSVGPFVDRFEREVAAFVGSAHAVAVASGTAGLHMALAVVGVRPGDEVLVSDLTFVAPANAIRYCQAEPVFVDVEPRTWQMDVSTVERFLRACPRGSEGCRNPRTGRRIAALLPVHILGMACDIERLSALGREFGVPVVEDAAEAMGVRCGGRHAGTFADAGVFSFNGNKVITCGGGGIVVTPRRELAAKLRYLTTQAKDDPLEYIHHEVGYNYRLTNLQAALGCAQLEQLPRFLARKRAIAQGYAAALRDVDALTLMPQPAGVEATWWLYTVLLPMGTTVPQRQAILRRLHAQGVEARPLWHPLHALPPFRACEQLGIEHAPDLYARAVSLPSSVGLTDAQVERCARALTDALADLR